MSSYRLTRNAERDLLDIFLYGFEAFGRSQAFAYREGLIACFELLADNPRLGRKAETVGPQARRHEHAPHVVFYEETESGILITAIVHGRSVRHLKV